MFGVQGSDRDWLLRRQVPHPFGPYHDVLHYDAARPGELPRTYIACTAPVLATAKLHHERVRSLPGWQVVEMATGHCPMVSAPQALAELLLHAAR